jgi:hypothetical protein
LFLPALLLIPLIASYGQSDTTFTFRQKIVDPDLVIQVGAFHLEQNALALRNRLTANLGREVVIIQESGYFKVRITGFTNIGELEKIIPALGLLGMKNLWVVPQKKPEEFQSQVIVRPDTTQKAQEEREILPVDTKIDSIPPKPGISLLAGSFHRKGKAYRAQRKITKRLSLPVEIVKEWEYYKVIIPGFSTIEETHRFYPELADIGYPDVLLLENYKKNQ